MPDTVVCDLQNGYRRFNDNVIRRSAARAGTLEGGSISCKSDGDDGLEETSVYVLLSEGESVFVTDAMAAEISFRTKQKETVEEGERRTCPTITKGE